MLNYNSILYKIVSLCWLVIRFLSLKLKIILCSVVPSFSRKCWFGIYSYFFHWKLKNESIMLEFLIKVSKYACALSHMQISHSESDKRCQKTKLKRVKQQINGIPGCLLHIYIRLSEPGGVKFWHQLSELTPSQSG